METEQALANENRNNPQPEGRQAKWDDRQTDYEGPAGLWYLSGCAEYPRRCPIGQKWGPGCPRRRFGYFAAEGKVTAGCGGA